MEVGVESTYIALSTQPAEFKNLGDSETLQNILPSVTEDKMLNRRVHTRRQLQANEALCGSSAAGQAAESPKPKKRGRKPKKQPKEQKVAGQQEELDDGDLPKDPRRRRVLERNRIAANKCRLRKRDEALALASRKETMEDQNRYLVTCFDSLTVEVYHLKTQLLRHTDCNCVLIQNYIANEAQKCVDRLVACSTAFDTYGNSLSPCDGSPSGASTAEELNTQSLNGGRFLSTPESLLSRNLAPRRLQASSSI
ncbi:Transcription factor Jun [Fusarium oxysporum f. sp. vasinfectum]|nr:Transcription factor Jun [Fusarium oxysporum f. sp. vasinfectum]